MLKRVLRSWIRENSGGRLVRFLIRRCEGFLYVAYNNGYWDFEKNGEARVLNIVARHLADRAPVVLDVGAHFGEWCEACATIMPNAQILSFELIKDQAAVTRETHKANPNVTVFDFGLSDSDQEVEISYNPGAGRATSIAPRMRSQFFAGHELTTALCQVRRGDRVTELLSLPRIDLLKIDTEGHEVFVLQGLVGLLEQPHLKPTVIQFEYGDTFIPQRATLLQIYELLEPLDFEIGRIGPHGVDFKPYRYADEHYYMGNYLAVQGAPELKRKLQGVYTR